MSTGKDPNQLVPAFQDSPDFIHNASDPTNPLSFPLFVTWNIVRPDSRLELRGCIGNFSPMPLKDGLKQYALMSALNDHRFPAISSSELESLHCSVSLLVHFERVSPTDWNIGEHGIRICFQCPETGKNYTGTFLPEVASDQKWTHQETIYHLIRKSGYRGSSATIISDRSFQVTRYRSAKVGASYQEYQSWKKNHNN